MSCVRHILANPEAGVSVNLCSVSWPNAVIRSVVSIHLTIQARSNICLQAILVLCFFLTSVSTSLAQKQANIWYFGRNAGLDFSSGNPVALVDGELNTTEGSAGLCDEEGKLLFYTDGVTVWNQHHQVMPNGKHLWGSYTTTQTLIVPKPGMEPIYYIFTASPQYNILFGEDSDSVGLHYSIVDTRLNGGNGDVIAKNLLLLKNTTEKVAAIRHSNGKDIWIVVHEWNSNIFRAHLLTEDGLQLQPILSSVGRIHDDTGEPFQVVHLHAIGQMKFSSAGTKLAIAIYDTDVIEIFDFDNSNGQVKVPFATLQPTDRTVVGHFYGLEFSSSGQSLFYTQSQFHCGNNEHLARIFQYIFETKETLLVGEFLGSLNAMQLGPDGKIYVALCNDLAGQSNYMGVINFPERRGRACEFTTDQVDLKSGKNYLGLPNFVQSWFRFPDPVVEMPNVFTPNDDALNPTFMPSRFENIIAAEMRIFNRWGEEIFCTHDPMEGWNGASVSPGIYYWTLRYEGRNGKNGQQKGWVSLIM